MIHHGRWGHLQKRPPVFPLGRGINFEGIYRRSCTQSEPEAMRGKCVQKDDMSKILKSIDEADGIVLASPLNRMQKKPRY